MHLAPDHRRSQDDRPHLVAGDGTPRDDESLGLLQRPLVEARDSHGGLREGHMPPPETEDGGLFEPRRVRVHFAHAAAVDVDLVRRQPAEPVAQDR